MNKQTRLFIFNIMAFFLCTSGFGLNISEMRDHTWSGGLFNWVTFILVTLGMIFAAIGLYQSLHKD